MAVGLDTMRVLFEADTSGLQAQIKKGGDFITTLIGDLNKKEINWRSIITKTLSATLWAELTAVLALAVTEILSFENAMAKAASDSSDSFQENIRAMSEQAVKLAQDTTVSANDAAIGLAHLSKTTLDSATQMAIAAQSTHLAQLRGLDYVQTVDAMAEVMQKWNINTAPGAISAMDLLNNAEKNSAFSWKEFVDLVIETGPTISRYTSFGDAVEGLAAFSKTAGMTKDAVTDVMHAIVRAIDQPDDALGVLASHGKTMGALIDEKGIVGAFQGITEYMNSTGIAATILAQKFGISKDTVEELRRLSSSSFTEMRQQMLSNVKAMQTLDQEVVTMETSTDKLKIAWNNFKNAFLDTGIMDMLKDIISLLLDAGTAIEKGLVTGVKKVGQALSPVKSVLEDVNKGVGDFLFGPEVDYTTPILNLDAQKRALKSQLDAQNKKASELLDMVPGAASGVPISTSVGLPIAKSKTSTATPTPNTQPSIMGTNTAGNVFYNTFLLGGESQRQFAEGFVKQIQQLMYLS